MKYSLIKPDSEKYSGIERIFYNRGFLPEDIEHYLNVTEKDTNSASLLSNIKDGVRLLSKHILLKDRIGILVDADADGYTSAALVYNYLNDIFPIWSQNHLTYFIHEDKKHGLSDSIDKILDSGIKLILVIDAGGTDGEYIETLKEHDIDTIIIDHHHTELEGNTSAIIINNQLGDYPNKTLSGVGVAYKFCQYIDELLGHNKADNYLDLVAVGCVADLMPLTDYETLYYIRTGLANIKNPFLKEMVKRQEYTIFKHGKLDPFCVSFYIAPYINATVRVGTIEDKQILFESMLNNKGMELIPTNKRGHKGELIPRAEEAVRIVTNVKTRQNQLRDDNLKVIEQIIEEKDLLKNKIIAVKLSKSLNIDKNILGLIANILMEKYQRPILLLNEVEEDGELYWTGSGRNYDNSEIEDLRGFLESLNYVEWASGHSSAFGTCIKDEDFNNFIEYTNKDLEDFDFSRQYKVDFIFKNTTFDKKIILDINSLKEYWGQHFEEPLVAIENFGISKENLDLLSKDKNPTLKIKLNNGVELIKFNSSLEEYEQLAIDGKIVKINAVGTCTYNYWNGVTTPQILIKDYEIIDSFYDF